uniref:tRNA:m(4)X modification enzyme TRM13 n=1 Tax=Nicotiana tabacum TaxID=4097 RepID=A0A1S4DGQ9_TOBAC|nr:PREDICTED: tRNA:m(4)X modification enzyme TRM13 homolog [Nicotiana tabacum]
MGFDQIKGLYANDVNFGKIFVDRKLGPFERFNLQDGYLFKENKLCIPNCPLREVFVREAHCGGLMGHFGVPQILDILAENFFWPGMRKDVERKTKAEMKKIIHEQTRLAIEKRNEQTSLRKNKGRKQVIFKPGDLVWVHFRKEKFPSKRKSKLHPRGDGPFQVLERIGDNAYKLDLPGEFQADRSLRQKESVTLERLRIDFEDLKLDDVESLQGVPYLAIGKHLCGPATDMTLRCCIGEQCDDSPSESTCHMIGLAIATCCHHLCQWKHYINKQYMLNSGISKDDFNAMTWFTSWAVDADHGSDLSGTDWSFDLQIRENEHVESDLNTYEVRDMVKDMKAVDRAVVGLMCKDIIDVGRFMWLKEHGLECELVKYVQSNISPENRLLVGRQKS